MAGKIIPAAQKEQQQQQQHLAVEPVGPHTLPLAKQRRHMSSCSKLH